MSALQLVLGLLILIIGIAIGVGLCDLALTRAAQGTDYVQIR